MRYFRAIVCIILIISVLVILVIAGVQVPQKTCTRVQVVPHTQNESVLLDQQDVEKLFATAGLEVVGKRIKEVDLPAINKKLKENPYIKEINSIHFAGARLVIDYTLRNILLHVYTQDGAQYFVDNEGFLIPYSPKMKDYLFIANGNIHQHYKQGATVAKELLPILELANLLSTDNFYKDMFRQIYRNDKNQLELVSTVGNQVILFGNLENAAEKLDNLKQVYTKGLTRQGYNKYAFLDVRYKNRVIAHHR